MIIAIITAIAITIAVQTDKPCDDECFNRKIKETRNDAIDKRGK